MWMWRVDDKGRGGEERPLRAGETRRRGGRNIYIYNWVIPLTTHLRNIPISVTLLFFQKPRNIPLQENPLSVKVHFTLSAEYSAFINLSPKHQIILFSPSDEVSSHYTRNITLWTNTYIFFYHRGIFQWSHRYYILLLINIVTWWDPKFGSKRWSPLFIFGIFIRCN